MKNSIRKCSICRKEIDTSNIKEDFFYSCTAKNVKCTHVKCYVDHGTHLKKGKKTVEQCLAYVEECRKKTAEIQKEEKTKQNLFDFISDMYEVTFLPQKFFVKMDSVFDGKYKGLSKCVPPEDLYDMWIQKKSYLEKVYDKNKKNGKEFDKIGRIYYDLAILLSKYDSYLDWKEQQKLAMVAEEENRRRNTDFIGYNKLEKPYKTSSYNSSTNIDINAMLDEI